MKATNIFRDPRHFQIAYLGGFLAFGLLTLGWQAEWFRYLTILLTALSVQFIALRLVKGSMDSLKSALITALGLCLLLKANSLWTLAFATSLAIGSKFLIRYKGKHIFNPANLGIIAALLTGDAWVSPGQWGSATILLFVMGACGTIVLFRVGRIDTSLAFIGTFATLLFGWNVLYKGWPLDHVQHSLTSGTLLLFTFFMITDPVTTPRKPKARILWAMGIAMFAFVLTGWHYVHTAPIWALIAYAPITVLLDRKLTDRQFRWTPQASSFLPGKAVIQKVMALIAFVSIAIPSWAFCGFYVAKADAKLFNKASSVIIARDGTQTVITMSSDFSGSVEDFAMVVPVPEILEREQIRLADQKIFDKLDGYSAPRLVEYNDPYVYCGDEDMLLQEVVVTAFSGTKRQETLPPPKYIEYKDEKVKVERVYEVGEFDILILSAEESDGLERWLTQNGYQIPSGAAEVLEPYIKSEMKFFVVRVNLDRNRGKKRLRPIQMQFHSERFG
ncbi:MAG: DUF2330 domain-containing protein, partial [Bacteroidota bacterium]